MSGFTASGRSGSGPIVMIMGSFGRYSVEITHDHEVAMGGIRRRARCLEHLMSLRSGCFS